MKLFVKMSVVFKSNKTSHIWQHCRWKKSGSVKLLIGVASQNVDMNNFFEKVNITPNLIEKKAKKMMVVKLLIDLSPIGIMKISNDVVGKKS